MIDDLPEGQTQHEGSIGQSASTAGLGGAFQREIRYAVLKWKDVAAALTPAEIEDLRHLMWKTHDYRENQGKTRYVECVVVEEDWPEYEPTWRAIEARMTPNVEVRGAEQASPAERPSSPPGSAD